MILSKIFNMFFHPPEYPGELPTKGGRLAYWYHWHMYLVDTGRGHVFGKVEQLFGEVGFFLLLIDKLGYAKLTIPMMLLIAIVGAIVIWLTGWLYILLKLDIVRTILTRYRDVMFKDIYDWMKKK